ncbi:MAG: hypothetical protein J6X48_05345 [Lachnospiraceae bacterium]|nr:hypothetical protein [Lachnospiraceae bacterium]
MHNTNVIDLSGEWLCKSEDGSVNKKVKLPGSSCENGIGKKAEYYKEYSKEAVRAPREKYEFIGKLIYTKEVNIPKEYEGTDLTFFFERVNISSKLFIDGVQVGRETIGLSTPHIYKISDRVNEKGEPLFKSLAGKHEVKLIIDNSDLLHIGNMASGYSVDTQGYWNGVIGEMKLISRPVNHIESVQVFPEESDLRIETVTISDRHVPMEIKKAKLKYELFLPNGTKDKETTQEIELFSKRQRNRINIPISKKEKIYWDEFDHELFKVKVTLITDKETFEYTQDFGYRKVYVKDKEFRINNRLLSLRGTINCAQYPLTGYPPMDKETWVNHFKILKEYGLNHVRFHAWCPPEAAFKAADELGLYLGIEMPLWLNRDVTPYEFGDDDYHIPFFREEALKIVETYGNHPSFVFFANGNENLGDYAMLETMIAQLKAIDNRHLYTLTSNFDHPLSPYEDYLCAFEILHNKARIQFLHDEVTEGTCVNYEKMKETVPVPFTSFEVGQYCVYPDVDIIEKYTGAMLPVNFDAIKKEMVKHGVYERLHDYVLASGDLACKLYKEDIEAVLRTKGMGGFQLLSLTDYTGQSTATVGILDVMYESKGIVEPKNFKEFCSEIVPLFEAKRIYKIGDTIKAKVSLYDASKNVIKKPVFDLKIVDSKTGKAVYNASFKKTEDKTKIEIPIDFVNENSLLKVYISVKGEKEYTNSWRIFVYKDEEASLPKDKLISTKEDYEKALKIGGKYIITPNFYEKQSLTKNSFIPVFWSPVHFPSKAPVGFMIDKDHPILANFPSEEYADYQWKELVDNSVSLNLKDIKGAKPVLEFVPNFTDNEPKSALFTYKEKNAEFVFCGFDLKLKSLPTKALKKSIVNYINA